MENEEKNEQETFPTLSELQEAVKEELDDHMLFNSFLFIFLFLPLTLLGWYGLNHYKHYELAKVFLEDAGKQTKPVCKLRPGVRKEPA